jgi:chemotaxis methyl-accepting protein methylase
MHKLTASTTLLEHELSELRQLIERQSGLVLDCPSSALAAHVTEYLDSQRLDSPAMLLERLRLPNAESAELAPLLDGLLNANTGFFRHPGAMAALTRQVLPQLHARKSSEGSIPLRIWSAGCSTGEEAYSIAMAVCDAAPAGSNGNSNGNGNGNGNGAGLKADHGVAPIQAPKQAWSVHIVGSDLLPSAIATAERGLYPHSALAGLSPAIIRANFSKIGEYLLVKPRLRSMVTFNGMNLARSSYIGRFDCIFCMDVLPQFSRPQRQALLERLHLYLEPGGYLFLGQSEKLAAPNLNFRSETFDGHTFHRKPLAASAAYGR